MHDLAIYIAVAVIGIVAVLLVAGGTNGED